MDIINLSLHQKFRKLAFDINKMKNRQMSLLLEIYQKEIYKEHNCATIYEYGFKYAKLSRETVQLALRTLKNTEDKPLLREKIETQGIYKVSMVAKLATPKTDKLYSEHVENMSKPVLFEFAKEMRDKVTVKASSASLSQDFDVHVQRCRAVIPKMTIELDEEAQTLFNQLKKRYAKDLSNKEALKNISSQQKDVPGNGISKNFKISNRKIQKTIKQGEKNKQKSDARFPTAKPTKLSRKVHSKGQSHPRYIKVQTQRIIHQKTNGKCAYPACTRPIENLHHTTPFAFNRSHDSIVGLCEIHHSFCHNGIIKNELKDPSQWELNLTPQKSLFDSFYLKYKAGKI